MNKKGFTLIELLAVIAILAILIILIVPNVIQIYNEAEEETFVLQTENIKKTAEAQWLKDNINGKTNSVYDYENNKLDLSGIDDDIRYYVSFDSNGELELMVVDDGVRRIKVTNPDTVIDSESIIPSEEELIPRNVYDVNGDGVVDTQDVEEIMHAFVGDITYDNNTIYKYDLSCDGIVDVSDTLIINSYLSSTNMWAKDAYDCQIQYGQTNFYVPGYTPEDSE